MLLAKLATGGFRPLQREIASPSLYWPKVTTLSDVLYKLKEKRCLFGVVLPTYFTRMTEDEHRAMVKGVVSQFEDFQTKDYSIAIFVCMQWTGAQYQLACERLEKVMLECYQRSSCIHFVGVLLQGQSKTDSLNVCLSIAKKSQMNGMGWVDDDVILGKNCLLSLIHHFRSKKCKGAVGASKVAVTKPNRASRLLQEFKDATRPSMNYPHGCCILVEMEILKDGIPNRYESCEDGFICFEVIRRNIKNPFAFLEIIDDAKCTHWVGGPWREIMGRVRRIVLNHLILLGDYSSEVSSIYIRECLFADFGKYKRGLRKDMLRSFFQLIYMSIFVYYWTGLVIRKIMNRPLRKIAWAGYQDYKR